MIYIIVYIQMVIYTTISTQAVTYIPLSFQVTYILLEGVRIDIILQAKSPD